MNAINLPARLERTDSGQRWVYGLIGVWVLSMISLPIFLWTVGEPARVYGINVTTLLQCTASLAALSLAWQPARIITVALIVVAATLAAEAIGTATGYPFGTYHYTEVLQPQVLDVPLIITLAWLMMLPAAWAVAATLTGGRYGIGFVLLSAGAMTAWDLFLDPQMVGWNLWTWEDVGSSSYFGIPWINYGGWLLVSALVTVIARPRELPIVPLLVIYTTVWLLQSVGMIFFWGMVAPGVVGFVVMGSFAVMSWRARMRTIT